MAAAQGGGSCPYMDNLPSVIKSAMNSIIEEDAPHQMVYETASIKRRIEEVDDENERPSNNSVQVCVNKSLNQGNQSCDTSNITANNVDKPVTPSQESGSVTESVREKYNPVYYEKCKNNSYSSSDPGPYVLYVEKSEGGYIQAMQIGRIIRTRNFGFYKNILNIKKIGRNRVKVSVTSAECANALLSASFWSENKLLCYIPSFMLFRQGVVRDVDCAITEEEIKEDMISDRPIASVRRVHKKDKNNILRPTPVVIVSFRGQTLPSEVRLLGVICKVDSYVQRVLQCFRCLRFGHSSQLCKSQERCRRCGGNNHNSAECENPLVCVHCKGRHMSTDSKVCLEHMMQRKIKIRMAHDNISHLEARMEICNPNSYASRMSGPQPDVLSGRDFPSLSAPPVNPVGIQKLVNQPNYALQAHSEVSQMYKQQTRVVRENDGSNTKRKNFRLINNSQIMPEGPVFDNDKYKENININNFKEIVMSILNKINSVGISLPFEMISSLDIDGLIRQSFKESATLLPKEMFPSSSNIR